MEHDVHLAAGDDEAAEHATEDDEQADAVQHDERADPKLMVDGL
jgi:hypothetical protein